MVPQTQKVVLRTRRWKRVEYDRLVELGLFTGERLELLDGVLSVREPQGSRHAAAIRRVVEALRRALGDTWQIDSQLPIALDDESEPEPDVSVVARDPTRYRDAHPSRPVLVVEIADSSYRIDRHFKLSLYARAALPEYWIIDVPHETVEAHRAPTASSDAPLGWRYARTEILTRSDTIRALCAPRAPLSVADLLP
jgi:Uma2 family endonuclease